MELGEITASVASQVALADAVLGASHSQLRLSGVTLRLQGAATMVGDSTALDLTSPIGGSTLDLAFHVEDPETGPGRPVPVPDVRGYTSALARRKLQDAGLRFALAAPPNNSGRVGKLHPPPGTQVLTGTLVQVVLR